MVSSPRRPATPLELRLTHIFAEVTDLIARHEPESVALEDLFVGGNPRTILSVGHARGAVLTACGRAGVAATGYPPAEVKLTVCGFGRADKTPGAADGGRVASARPGAGVATTPPTRWRSPSATPTPRAGTRIRAAAS